MKQQKKLILKSLQDLGTIPSEYIQEKLYDIADKNGTVLPDHYTGRGRALKEAEHLIDALNKNGEHKPYKIINLDIPKINDVDKG